MASKTVATPGSQSLAEFQKVVQQMEGIYGPLTALGKEGSNNTITLEIGTSPANRAVLETYEGKDPPAKPGYALICKGDCLVDGKPATVAAYRLPEPGGMTSRELDIGDIGAAGPRGYGDPVPSDAGPHGPGEPPPGYE